MDTLRDIPLAELHESLSNPRKVFAPEALRELAEDIKAHGLLQPILVRPAPAGFEVVCGARRFRACTLAGLPTVRAVVRELDDRAVLEAQISENARREGVHPLEEADAFQVLHTQHRVPVEEIAHRIGAPASFVYNRLALARLCPEARTAYTEGKLLGGVAQRLARLPLATQVRATMTLTKPRWTGAPEVWPLREALGWIEGHCVLQLADALFDPEDAALVPSAGKCSACPKNSAAQASLFGEPDNAACMDADCHKAKVDADWSARTAEYAARGQRVLPSDARFYGAPLDEKAWAYGGDGKKTWAELLGPHAPKPVVASYDGQPVEMYDREELAAAAKAAGLDKSDRPGPTREKIDYEAVKRRREAVDAATLDAAREALDRRAGLTNTERADWQWITSVMACFSYNEEQIAKQRGVEDLVADEIPNLSASGCRALVVELLLDSTDLDDRCVALTARWLGLDLEAIGRRVDAEAEAAQDKADAEAKAVKKASKPGSRETLDETVDRVLASKPNPYAPDAAGWILPDGTPITPAEARALIDGPPVDPGDEKPAKASKKASKGGA